MGITHGLDRAHIGTICDALTAAGIDPTVWSAHAVNDKLNTDMRVRGLTWPDHIANPGAFLHSRLRRLSWTPPEPARKAGGSAAASLDQTPPPVVLTDASRARIAAAREEIRRVLTGSAQHTATEHTYAHGSVPHRSRLRTLAIERTHPSRNASLDATTTPQHRHISTGTAAIRGDAQPQ